MAATISLLSKPRVLHSRMVLAMAYASSMTPPLAIDTVKTARTMPPIALMQHKNKQNFGRSRHALPRPRWRRGGRQPPRPRHPRACRSAQSLRDDPQRCRGPTRPRGPGMVRRVARDRHGQRPKGPIHRPPNGHSRTILPRADLCPFPTPQTGHSGRPPRCPRGCRL